VHRNTDRGAVIHRRPCYCIIAMPPYSTVCTDVRTVRRLTSNSSGQLALHYTVSTDCPSRLSRRPCASRSSTQSGARRWRPRNKSWRRGNPVTLSCIGSGPAPQYNALYNIDRNRVYHYVIHLMPTDHFLLTWTWLVFATWWHATLILCIWILWTPVVICYLIQESHDLSSCIGMTPYRELALD